VEQIIEDLKRDEGFRGVPYVCTGGMLTVGYGRNLVSNGLTENEADYLLRNDVARAIIDLQILSFWAGLSSVRRDVLVNMCVNLGFDGLMQFKKMLKALADRDYRLAADEMIRSRWYTQTGSRARRLVGMMIRNERECV